MVPLTTQTNQKKKKSDDETQGFTPTEQQRNFTIERREYKMWLLQEFIIQHNPRIPKNYNISKSHNI